ncbi:MAG: class I SAM-dependent methyltransferase [Anaerolineae bacterium]|nr:class I SAM-dependent methyltransferase [Anaerolineae bacterium]
MSDVILKPGKVKPVRNRHPWIFSGAIQRIKGNPANGDIVNILDTRSRFLARGYLNRLSQITVRILTWNDDENIDEDFFLRRLQNAIAARSALKKAPDTNAFRLCYGESDLIPGLIVDRYEEHLILQALTMGIERWKECIADLLLDLLHPQSIYERSDVPSRRKEGLPLTAGSLRGSEPPDLVETKENGHRFLVDIKKGQKTGFYLDQRENRRKVSLYCKEARVLNCFAYTGGFSVYAAAAGAISVDNVDSSIGALEIASQNMALNGFEQSSAQYTTGDVFQLLRDYGHEGRTFDLIILDPPKFAPSQGKVAAACRGYKDINLLAMRILKPGGILATFSCSSLINTSLFQKVLFGASVDAGRDVHIIEYLSQGSDHPVLLTFPESAYLKGLLCRVH